MPKTVLFDLDQTLIDADYCTRPNCSHDIVVTGGSMITGQICYVHQRPGCRELLQWCDQNELDIIIFSAADGEYVNKVVDILFDGLDFKPIFTLDGGYVTWCNVGYTKKLSVVEEATGVPITDIVAIDDNENNFLDEGRCIHIHPWDKDERNDDELVKIREHIMSKLGLGLD